jgi:hypothetical protein
VCCRVREYEAAAVRLSGLQGAVCLQPLSDRQIQDYLTRVGRSELWAAVQESAEMRQLLEPDEVGEAGLLRVPLFVAMAAAVYEPGQRFGSKAELLEKYWERQLAWDTRESDRRHKPRDHRWAYRTVELEPDRGETRRYLGWLAKKLKENYRTELLIERMQPWWLSTKKQEFQYKLTVCIMLGLAVGGGLLPLAALNDRLLAGFIATLLTVLIITALMLLLHVPLIIEPIESFRISIKKLTSSYTRKKIKHSLFWGMAAFIIGLLLRLKGSELILTLIFVPVFHLIPDLIFHLKQDLKVRSRSRPNQGIWNSFQNALFISVGFYLVGVLSNFALTVYSSLARNVSVEASLASIWQIPLATMISGAIAALLFGFSVGGGLPFIQHFSLRFIFTCYHLTPWRYIRFLKYCTERRLLQQVGGRYRFIHRELLEHLAK